MSCERASGDTGQEEGAVAGSAFIEREGGRGGPGLASPHRGGTRRLNPPRRPGRAGPAGRGECPRRGWGVPAWGVPGGTPALAGTEDAAGAVKSLINS